MEGVRRAPEVALDWEAEQWGSQGHQGGHLTPIFGVSMLEMKWLGAGMSRTCSSYFGSQTCGSYVWFLDLQYKFPSFLVF